MKRILLFTDGASSGNPGPGGWGAVLWSPALRDDSHADEEARSLGNLSGMILELGGHEALTTNNRMELTAVLKGLEEAHRVVHELQKEGEMGPFTIEVYTDSAYVVDGITGWVAGWKKRGWVTVQGDPVLNRELWESLDGIVQQVRQLSQTVLAWNRVPGHSGIAGNERADKISVAFSKRMPVHLFDGEARDYSINLLDFEVKEEGRARAKKARSSAPAYCYLSQLSGVIERHKTWAECEARVKGKSNARFKKALSEAEAEEIIREWARSSQKR